MSGCPIRHDGTYPRQTIEGHVLRRHSQGFLPISSYVIESGHSRTCGSPIGHRGTCNNKTLTRTCPESEYFIDFTCGCLRLLGQSVFLHCTSRRVSPDRLLPSHGHALRGGTAAVLPVDHAEATDSFNYLLVGLFHSISHFNFVLVLK